MKTEEKQLLLKDLCARLPYGVTINKKVCHSHRIEELIDIGYGQKSNEVYVNGYPIKQSKPYLRSMSSMTEEEFELLKRYSGLEYDQLDLAEFPNNHKCLDFYLEEVPSYTVILVFDWLNSHHFDYRGLITMGLALEAPEGMYKTE